MAPFTDFLLPSIILRDPDKYTLAVGLFNFINDRFANNFTRFAAGSILIAAPIAIVFLFLQRYLISGLTAGGTKG
jgi:arabinogalactan oligomer/maltooligosaccharide transport system permease protein